MSLAHLSAKGGGKMAWSYSGDPNTSSKDAVRFYTSDTDIENQLMSDEEILFLLSNHPNSYSAASKALEIMVANLLQQADTTIGELQIQYSQRATQLQGIISTMRSSTTFQMTLSFGSESGATSIGNTKVLFRKGMMDRA